MTIDFYKTSDPDNKINKSLTNKLTVTGKCRDVLNVLTPIIMVATDITNYNYCYIEDLARYYFITDITINRTGLYELKLKIDVLKTYSNDFSNCKILTSTSNQNKYMSGYAQTVDSRVDHSYYEFTNNFNESGSIILVGMRG